LHCCLITVLTRSREQQFGVTALRPCTPREEATGFGALHPSRESPRRPRFFLSFSIFWRVPSSHEAQLQRQHSRPHLLLVNLNQGKCLLAPCKSRRWGREEECQEQVSCQQKLKLNLLFGVFGGKGWKERAFIISEPC
jgi:hypothetical protein